LPLACEIALLGSKANFEIGSNNISGALLNGFPKILSEFAEIVFCGWLTHHLSSHHRIVRFTLILTTEHVKSKEALSSSRNAPDSPAPVAQIPTADGASKSNRIAIQRGSRLLYFLFRRRETPILGSAPHHLL